MRPPDALRTPDYAGLGAVQTPDHLHSLGSKREEAAEQDHDGQQYREPDGVGGGWPFILPSIEMLLLESLHSIACTSES